MTRNCDDPSLQWPPLTNKQLIAIGLDQQKVATKRGLTVQCTMDMYTQPDSKDNERSSNETLLYVKDVSSDRHLRTFTIFSE